MTLVINRPEVLTPLTEYGVDLKLAERAAANAARFVSFVNRRHSAEAHNQFYLNHSGHPGDQIAHAYFVETLLQEPQITIPDGMDIEEVADRPELDGKSVALHRNDELGLFVARQVFFLDRIPVVEYDGYIPPPEGSLLVDYYAGRVNPYAPISLL